MRQLATLLMMLACSTGARAQLDLKKLWESTQQLEIHLTASYISYPTLQRFDVNGDGVADLVMEALDDLGTVETLHWVVTARETATGNLSQSIRIEDLGLGEEASFFGFVRMGAPFAVMTGNSGGQDIHIYNVSYGQDDDDSSPVWRFSDVSPYPGRLLAALDLTNDGSDELIIIVTVDDANLVQVWGR